MCEHRFIRISHKKEQHTFGVAKIVYWCPFCGAVKVATELDRREVAEKIFLPMQDISEGEFKCLIS